MKRDDIEMKSDQYAQEATPTYVNGDFDRYAIAQSFEDGANWRIDSLWHDTKELPTKSCFIVYLTKLDVMEIMYYIKYQRSCRNRLMNYKKWAYKEDLMPNKEDEK